MFHLTEEETEAHRRARPCPVLMSEGQVFKLRAPDQQLRLLPQPLDPRGCQEVRGAARTEKNTSHRWLIFNLDLCPRFVQTAAQGWTATTPGLWRQKPPAAGLRAWTWPRQQWLWQGYYGAEGPGGRTTPCRSRLLWRQTCSSRSSSQRGRDECGTGPATELEAKVKHAQ